MGGLSGIWLVCGWYDWFVAGVAGLWLICGWFGWFEGSLDGLDGLWVVLGFTADVLFCPPCHLIIGHYPEKS